MRVLLGTSGYSYKEWVGPFYPPKTAAKKMLSYYASKLSTVEANGTFYRMPTKDAIATWPAEVGPDFVFSCKAPQKITHFARLKEGSYESLAHFIDVVTVLGRALGPSLFQLPPNLPKDAPRLAAFLAQIPAGHRAAFEFRHASWFDDEVYALLRAKNAALVIAETEDFATPIEQTARDWIYLRLRREDYVTADLARWAKQLGKLTVETAYVYFKHEDTGRGPQLAAELQQLL